MIRSRSVLPIALLALALPAPAPAAACSCVPLPMAHHVAEADVIVLARLGQPEAAAGGMVEYPLEVMADVQTFLQDLSVIHASWPRVDSIEGPKPVEMQT